MELTVKYDWGFKQETWRKSARYCVYCGKNTVWREEGPGDYYAGEAHICVSCDHEFYVPTINVINEYDKQMLDRLRQLKEVGR